MLSGNEYKIVVFVGYIVLMLNIDVIYVHRKFIYSLQPLPTIIRPILNGLHKIELHI